MARRSPLAAPLVDADRAPVVASTVSVCFGETYDGWWWAAFPDGRRLRTASLGELFDLIHFVLHQAHGERVNYQVRQIDSSGSSR